MSANCFLSDSLNKITNLLDCGIIQTDFLKWKLSY
jgi:hypothetical protein